MELTKPCSNKRFLPPRGAQMDGRSRTHRLTDGSFERCPLLLNWGKESSATSATGLKRRVGHCRGPGRLNPCLRHRNMAIEEWKHPNAGDCLLKWGTSRLR